MQFAPIPKNPKFNDLSGRTFVRLKVLGFAGIVNKRSRWWCKCECGTVKNIARKCLIGGDTKSCGCLSAMNASRRFYKHGMKKTREYRIWKDMRQRCLNRNNPGFQQYGLRGITICPRWNNFQNFYDDMGPSPSNAHSIDRKNGNGNYEPSNCRWATSLEQAENKQSTFLVEINGRIQSLTRWCRELCVDFKSAKRMIRGDAQRAPHILLTMKKIVPGGCGQYNRPAVRGQYKTPARSR